MEISVVVPVYKAEGIIPELCSRLVEQLGHIHPAFEIILVEDGSPDKSWEEMQMAAAHEPRIKCIQLSRNFGQHNAITAGLHYAKGTWIVVMDCDLQDLPEEIPQLYQKATEGFDMVLASREHRQDGLMKRWSSYIFYRLFEFLTDTQQDAKVANFGIYHRNVIQAVMRMGDQVRVFPILVQWVGFKKFILPVKHSKRAVGKSSYNLFKLIKLATDASISFSDKPLRISLWIGTFIASGSFLLGLVTLIRFITGAIKVPGYASIVISLWFLSGVIMAMLGITGLYLGKIMERVKDRPNFIVRQTRNIPNETQQTANE